LWCNRFGPKYAPRLKRKHRGYGDTYFIDEVFVRIDGKQYYLWRAVDQDGEILTAWVLNKGQASNPIIKARIADI